MKRKISILLTLMMVMSFMAIPVFAADAPAAPTVILDGTTLSFDVPPMIDNNRTLVPLRVIFEKMGASVTWDEATQTATAVKGETTVVLKIGSVEPTINGTVKKLDVPAKVVNNRTLAPLRFVGEAFGGTVNWDEATTTVTMTAAPATPAPTVPEVPAKPEAPVKPEAPAAPATAADLAKAVVANFAPVNATISLTGKVAGIVSVGAEATATIGADGVASAKIKGDAGPLGKSDATAAVCPYSELVYGPEAEALKVVSAATLKDSVMSVKGDVPASLVNFLNNVNAQVTWSAVTADAVITVDKNHVTKIVITNGKAKVATPLGDKEAVFEATLGYAY